MPPIAIPFEVFYVLGAFVLGAVLFVMWTRDKARNTRNDAVTDAATRAQYEQPESYEGGDPPQA